MGITLTESPGLAVPAQKTLTQTAIVTGGAGGIGQGNQPPAGRRKATPSSLPTWTRRQQT